METRGKPRQRTILPTTDGARSEAPGILSYLAKGIENASAVYNELTEDGYIVRAVHMNSDTEYHMREGALMPVPGNSAETSQFGAK